MFILHSSNKCLYSLNTGHNTRHSLLLKCYNVLFRSVMTSLILLDITPLYLATWPLLVCSLVHISYIYLLEALLSPLNYSWDVVEALYCSTSSTINYLKSQISTLGTLLWHCSFKSRCPWTSSSDMGGIDSFSLVSTYQACGTSSKIWWASHVLSPLHVVRYSQTHNQCLQQLHLYKHHLRDHHVQSAGLRLHSRSKLETIGQS